jgi:hypothetical protein
VKVQNPLPFAGPSDRPRVNNLSQTPTLLGILFQAVHNASETQTVRSGSQRPTWKSSVLVGKVGSGRSWTVGQLRDSSEPEHLGDSARIGIDFLIR